MTSLPEHLVPHLRALRVEKALAYVSGSSDRLDRVEAEARAETEALGTLAAMLQAQREHAAVQVATAMLSCAKPLSAERLEDEFGHEADADLDQVTAVEARRQSAGQGASHESEDPMRRYVRSLLQDTAELRARLEWSNNADVVPKSVADALEAELQTTKQQCQAALQCLKELRASLAAERPRFLAAAPGWKASDKSATLDDRSATLLRHPLWADFFADIEAKLGRQTALEDDFNKLQGLQPKLEALDRTNAELRQQLDDARSDAQVANYQNGVLVQQLASLLYKHHSPASLPPPVSRTDLTVFGPLRLPDLSSLRGAALVAPSGQPDAEVINLQAYSIHDVTELVERNNELAGTLFRYTNSKSATTTESRGADESDEAAALDGDLSTKRRFGETARTKYLQLTAGETLTELEIVGKKRARRGSEAPAPRRPLMALSQTEGDGRVLRSDKAVQSEPLDALKAIAEQGTTAAREVHATDWRGAPTEFTGSDTLGAERLVALALEASSWSVTSDRAREDAAAEERLLLQSALQEAHAVIERLEDRLADQARRCDLETRVNEQLRQRLADQGTREVSQAVMSGLEQKLSAPLEALACLERTLRANAPESEERTAGEALNTLQATFADVASLAESLAQQEDALKSSLGDAGSSTSHAAGIADLQQVVAKLREALLSEQQKLAATKELLNAQRMKNVQMLDHVWRADVRCEELEQLHQRDQQQFASLVPVERLREAQDELQKSRGEAEQLQVAAAQRTKEHEAAMEALNDRVAQANQQLIEANAAAAALQQQLDETRRKCAEATEAAISAQEEASRLQHDLVVVQQHQRYLDAQLMAKGHEISGLVGEIERQRNVIVTQQCSREHMLEMFPGDQAIKLTLQRLAEAEAEVERLQRQMAMASASAGAWAEKHKYLSDEHGRMEHRLTMSEAAASIAAEKARARITALEEQVSALQFQVRTEQGTAEQAKVELAAALAREATQLTKIEALSADPIATNVKKYGVQHTNDIHQQLEELQEMRLTALKEVESVKAQLTVAATARDAAARKCETLTEELSAAEANNQLLAKQLASSTADLGAAQRQLATVTQQLESSRKSIFGEQERVRAAAEQLAQAKKALEQRDATLQAMLSERDAAAAMVTQLQVSLTAAEARATDAAAVEAKAQRQLDEARRCNERLIEDNVDLKDSTQKLSAALQDAQTQLAAARRTHSHGGARKPASSLTAELLRRHEG